MERYESKLTAAYVWGAAMEKKALLRAELTEKPLEGLREAELTEILRAGEAAGLKMYHFKKKEPLPRVKAVMGFLKGVRPENLLDVGSGRGVFLFPFLMEFPRCKPPQRTSCPTGWRCSRQLPKAVWKV